MTPTWTRWNLCRPIFLSSLANLKLLVHEDSRILPGTRIILPGITVIRYRTRTSSLASKLTYFSSIKSNVSNYVQLHVRQKRNCHSPYRIVVDTVYSFRDWVWPWLKQIKRIYLEKMGKFSAIYRNLLTGI